jgi:hypothetical protein
MNAADYKHVFFNPKFGSLGMLVLPSVLFAMFTALYFTAYIIVQIGLHAFDVYVQYSTVGFTFHIPQLFYMNTSSLALLGYMFLALALSFLFIGRKLSGVSFKSFDIPLFLLCYGFLAPLWLTSAVVRAGMKAQAPWR